MSAGKGSSKRQAILEAAEREFLTGGFAAAKTKDIAAAAGVTHAMLHYYFGTKENLFNQVFDAKLKLMGESVLSLFTAGDIPFLDRVRRSVEAHFDFIRANPDLPHFILTEALSTSKRHDAISAAFHDLHSSTIRELQQVIGEEAQRGTIHPITAVDLMIDILSLNLWAFVMLPISEPLRQDIYGSVDEYLDARRRENVEVIMRRLKKIER